METTVLVTGATGNVGLEVIKSLKVMGNNKISIVAGVRSPSKSKQVFPDGIKCRKLDFEDKATLRSSLEGIDKVFLVRPPAISNVNETIFPFIDMAKACGVKHIVFLSLLGAEKNVVVPHHKIEKHLQSCGINYTFLRASFFMQNLSTTHQEEIKRDREICVPAGRGKTSFIDIRDIAEVAAHCLLESSPSNRGYDLTGGEALDYFEVASILSKALNKKILYTNPTLYTFYRKMRAKGSPTMFVVVMLGIYTTAKLGLAKRTTEDLEKLLGRKPITMRQYARDYAICWQS
jgi:uncharacterized protein YbjT (DUF2867 family)